MAASAAASAALDRLACPAFGLYATGLVVPCVVLVVVGEKERVSLPACLHLTINTWSALAASIHVIMGRGT